MREYHTLVILEALLTHKVRVPAQDSPY